GRLADLSSKEIERRACLANRCDRRVGVTRSANDIAVGILYGVHGIQEILLIQLGIAARRPRISIVEIGFEVPGSSRQHVECAVESPDEPHHAILAGRYTRGKVDVRTAKVEIVLRGTVGAADRRIAGERAFNVALAKRIVLDAILDRGPRSIRQERITQRHDQIAVTRSRGAEQRAIVGWLIGQVSALADAEPTLAKKANAVRQLVGHFA